MPAHRPRSWPWLDVADSSAIPGGHGARRLILAAPSSVAPAHQDLQAHDGRRSAQTSQCQAPPQRLGSSIRSGQLPHAAAAATLAAGEPINKAALATRQAATQSAADVATQR